MRLSKKTPREYKILEGEDDFRRITPETAFFVHCSNLQAWVDNDYDPAILDSRLAFPILMEIARLGDEKARRVLMSVVDERLASEDPHVLQCILEMGVIDFLEIDYTQRFTDHLMRILCRPLQSIKDTNVHGEIKSLDLEPIRPFLEMLPDDHSTHYLYRDHPKNVLKVTSLSSADEGRLIFLAFQMGLILCIDWFSDQIKQVFRANDIDYLLFIKASKDGKYIATKLSNHDTKIYETETGKVIFEYHPPNIYPALDFSRNDARLFYIEDRGEVLAKRLLSPLDPNGTSSILPKVIKNLQWDWWTTFTTHDARYAFSLPRKDGSIVAVDITTGKFLFKAKLQGSEEEFKRLDYLNTHNQFSMGESCTLDENLHVKWLGNKLVYEDKTMDLSFVILETAISHLYFGPSEDRKHILIWIIIERPFIKKSIVRTNGFVWKHPLQGQIIWEIPVLIFRWNIADRRLHVVKYNEDVDVVEIDHGGAIPIIKKISFNGLNEVKVDPIYPDLRRLFGRRSIIDLILNDDSSRIALISKEEDAPGEIFIWDIEECNIVNVFLLDKVLLIPSKEIEKDRKLIRCMVKDQAYYLDEHSLDLVESPVGLIPELEYRKTILKPGRAIFLSQDRSLLLKEVDLSTFKSGSRERE